jgi:Stage III sporulation protein AF (Spore_III_AF).
MKEFVQNILIYTIIITVLRGLITGPKYRQYFQFFSGVILILLFLGPVLSLFRSDRDWYRVLEEKLLQMDLAEIQGEMRVAEEGFEQMLCKRYEQAVREQVELLAEERGVSLEDAQVTLRRAGDAWEVAQVSGRVVVVSGKTDVEEEDVRRKGGKAGAQGKGSDEIPAGESSSGSGGGGSSDVEKVAVEAVTIGEEPMEDRQEDTSRKGRELKKQICHSFTLGKEQVYLWK